MAEQVRYIDLFPEEMPEAVVIQLGAIMDTMEERPGEHIPIPPESPLGKWLADHHDESFLMGGDES